MSMVNNNMNEKLEPVTPAAVKKPTKPNENGALHIEGFIKIFDPKTKQVFVEKQA